MATSASASPVVSRDRQSPVVMATSRDAIQPSSTVIGVNGAQRAPPTEVVFIFLFSRENGTNCWCNKLKMSFLKLFQERRIHLADRY